MLTGCNDPDLPGGNDATDTESSDSSSTDMPDPSAGTSSATSGETSGETMGETSGDVCDDVQVQLEPAIATVVLLLDQSGTMASGFPDEIQWHALYRVLMDPSDGVVTTHESQLRLGLTLFNSENGFSGGECPVLTTVDPMLDNHSAIDGVFASASPSGDTPIGESLAAVAQQLADLPVDGPKGIVVATNGEPDTCAVPDPQLGRPEALAGAEQAFDLGITTYIIGLGDDVEADYLQQMANIGVGKAPDDPVPAPYGEALDGMQLADAFEDTLDRFTSCELLIDREIDLDQACDGTVTLDGRELECGVDYELSDGSTLALMGEACEIYRDGGDHTVDARWPCGAV